MIEPATEMRCSLATLLSGRQPDRNIRANVGCLLVVLLCALACRETPPLPLPRDSSPPARRHARSAMLVSDVQPATPDVHVAAPAAPVVDASPPAHSTVDGGTRGAFLGLDDAALLRVLCDAPIERVERNRGGSTVSFRLRLAGGQKALFKPQQRAEVANFRAELAAYRMSRLLGLHRVPPACGRVVPRAMLQRAADASGDEAFSRRVMTELLGRGEMVPGAVLYWVPGALEPVPDVDQYPTLLDVAAALPPERSSLAHELSNLLVFDYVNDNIDRWSGGNVLRQRAAPGEAPGPMLFMDNGAAFSALHDGRGARPEEQARRLAAVGRFSRTLLDALRALDYESVRAAMAEDPLGACLSDAQITALLGRRDRVLARVAEVTAAHGEAVATWFP